MADKWVFRSVYIAGIKCIPAEDVKHLIHLYAEQCRELGYDKDSTVQIILGSLAGELERAATSDQRVIE